MPPKDFCTQQRPSVYVADSVGWRIILQADCCENDPESKGNDFGTIGPSRLQVSVKVSNSEVCCFRVRRHLGGIAH